MSKIKPKRSYTTGAVPTTSDLEANEIAINWVDGKAFTKTAAGNIVSVTLGGGGGGSANIVEATTAAGFPATGASQTLYVSTDANRVFRWSGSVYVEIGTAGGTGTDSDLRALFTPAAPTSVTATGGNAQATVSWTAPSVLAQTPITDYTVQFSTNSGSTWTTFTRAASSSTSATVTGLTNGTAVVFRVSATNGVGTSSYSTASSAVTPAAAAPIAYANKFGNGSYTLTGTGTITATVTSVDNNDTRLWLLIGTSGTLSYTVTASSENGYDGGALYRTSSSPASHSLADSGYSNHPVGLTVTSGIVTGTSSSTGTVAVTYSASLRSHHATLFPSIADRRAAIHAERPHLLVDGLCVGARRREWRRRALVVSRASVRNGDRHGWADCV
jgi:hypothetical protein